MRKIALLLTCILVFSMHVVFAQSRTVTGTVTDADDGSTLPGVSVVVKGTSIGTVTDIEGDFSLNVPNDAETLVFSFVGMATKEVELTSANSYQVEMSDAAISVDEVVVTALGIKKSEKKIGYAATTVSSERITETRSSDVMSSLSGKVAGVSISNTASDPGASTSVIIRGMGSLSNGGNQPLYIVDGVPINNSSTYSSDGLNNGYDFGNGANLVNPDAVESVTVLKGAAATALYGSRAANGVVMITTKTGERTKGIGITVNTGIQYSDILRLPEFQNEYGMGWSGDHTLIENGSWGPRMDGSMRLWGRIYNNSQKLKPFSPMENNVKDFFEIGFKNQNSISFSGATDKSSFYSSFSNVSEDGLIPTDADTYEKFTYTLNATHELSDKFKISANFNFGNQENHFSPTGQGLTMINSIYQIPRDISIVGLKDYENDPFNSLGYYFTPYGVANPYFIIDHKLNSFKQNKIYGKVQADYEILPELSASYRLSMDATNNETKIGQPEISVDPSTPNAGQIDEPGMVSKRMVRRHELDHDFKLLYDKQITDFEISALGGVNINERAYSSVHAEVNTLDNPYYYDLSNSPSTPIVNEYYQIRRLIGVYGQIDLGYKDFLYATLTARNDWSSTLPVDNNSFFYPGATLSFVFSSLLPENVQDILSFGQLRLAWGKTGRDADPYSILPYYIKAESYNEFGNITFPIGGVNAFEMSNLLGSNTLSPEMSNEREIGLRLDFFQKRIGIDASYYDRRSTQQIFDIDMDPATGYTSQTTNIGEISNKGIELLLTLVPVKTNDFSWTITTNYTKNNNELVSLPEELGDEIFLYGFGTTSSSTHMVAQVGKPIGIFKVTVPERDPDGNIVVSNATGEPVAAADPEIVGDANYDYTMGINNMFKYKNFSLSFDFDIRQGGLMYSRTKDINYFVGNVVQTLYNDRQPFVVPNSVNKLEDGSYVENSTPVMKENMYNYFGNGGAQLNEGFLVDRSYVKLRSLSFGYNIPKRWINGTFIQSAKVSVYGSNLLLWTPASNTFIDPEVSSFGNDLVGMFGEYTTNPSTRRFGFNLQVSF